MGYVNLPADLQGIFQTLENRVDKLENAQRFTLPNVPVTVTAATGSGTTVTYTARNNFLAGQVVTVSGLAIGSGTSLNLVNVSIASATYSQFTVTNTTVGVSAGTGTAVAVATSITTNVGDPTYPRLGDQWLNMTNNTIGFVDARGGTGNILSTYGMKVTDTDTSLGSFTGTYQNLFTDGVKLTLAPYRTYRIDAVCAFQYIQSSVTAADITLGVYTGGSYALNDFIAIGGNNNNNTNISPNPFCDVISSTIGIFKTVATVSGIVRTGSTAATVYPYIYSSAANVNTPVSLAGSSLIVTSLGNSAGIQVGPWA